MKTLAGVTAIFLLLACAAGASAQVTNTALVAAGQATNVVLVAADQKSNVVLINFWQGLIVLVVPMLVLGIKKLLPVMPKVAWPILAALLGVAADWLLTQSGAIAIGSWEMGALCGAAGVGLREAAKQVLVLVGVGTETATTNKGNPTTPV